MAGLKVKIGADASQFERTMRNVRKEVGGVKRAILGVGAATGAILAVNKAFDAMRTAVRLTLDNIKKASEAAAGFEMLSVQFETLTGSAETAAELMAIFREEAQKSSLTLEDWAKGSRTLLQYGTAAEEVVDTMKMIGDVSLGNSEQFKFMSIAFAQVAAAGRLMGQEVRQMVNAGFNPLQQISERTGESMLKLKKRMEAGQIPFEEVRQAFVDATSDGGRFYKAIERGSGTTTGKTNQLKDAIFGLRLSFGEGFNEGLNSAMDALKDFLSQFEEHMQKAGEIVGSAIRDAVDGNLAMFEEMGRLIGGAILGGIDAAFTAGVETIFAAGLEALAKAPGAARFLGTDSETLRRGAALTREGRAAGLRGNIEGIKSGVAQRTANLEQLNRESRARIPIDMFPAPASPQTELEVSQSSFLGEMQKVNARLDRLLGDKF